jgi:hypothetical protein
VQARFDAFTQPFEIVSVTKLDGTPVEGLKKVPGYLPTSPNVPFKNPTTVPTFPGQPDFPITPTVIPNPSNNPADDESEEEPGVIVKIPETGQQIRFTPSGVSIGRYKAPDTEPFEVEISPPPIDPPRVAAPPCPCPEDKPDPKKDEILCRVKALQGALLNDGYTYTTTAGGSGQGVIVDISPNEIYAVAVQVTAVPADQKQQKAATGTPTVFYLGWFSWVYAEFPGERLPVHFLNTNWIAPAGATGYLVSLHDGVSATSQYLTRQPKDYVDRC